MVLPVLLIISGVILGAMTNSHFFYLLLAPVAGLIMTLIYSVWLWVAGIRILKMAAENSHSNVKAFKTLLLVSILSSFIILPVLGMTILKEYPVLFLFLRSIALSCFLIGLYLVSKNLGIIEKKYFARENVILIDCILLWMLPIGIWILQPRIKKLIYQNEQEIAI